MFLLIIQLSMQSQQAQIQSLLKKIQQQQESISKLKNEQTKLGNYVKQFKQTIERKMSKQMQNSHKNNTDEDKIEKQLQKQLQNAKLMLKNYQNQLKNLQKKSTKNKYTADDLLEMENNIKKRQAQVKELNDDIKNLTIVKRKQEKLIEKKQKNQDGSKLTKLVDQIRKQKDVLQGLKVKHKLKQEALQKKRLAIDQIQKQYIQKCKKYGQKPLSFEDFRERRIQKRRDQSVNKGSIDKKQAKKYLSIKDIINSHLDIQNIEISQKSLQQLREKKAVAQTSLKIAKKKYDKQIQQLQQRLQTLKGQHESLQTRYLQKKKQRQLVQTSKTIGFKKNSSKTMRKLDPIK